MQSAAEGAAQPLALAVHAIDAPDLADPAAAAQRRTAIGRLKMLLVLAVCAAPVVASYLAFYVVRPESRSNYGSLIVPTRALPELGLRTLEGAGVASPSLHGQWLLIAVGPASCSGECEKRLHLQRQLREMLGRERDRLDKLWLVTDEAALRPELRAALGATPVTTVLRVEREALARWLAPEAGRALEDHLYLVDPMGQWMMRLPSQAEPARAKRDLDRLLRAAASWDRAGR